DASGYDDAFDSFSYTVTDGYNFSPADQGDVQINLTNQLPAANPDFYDVSHNVTLDITDLALGTIEGLLPGSEDIDPDPGDTLSAYLDAGGTTTQGGNVVLETDGTFTYTPPSNTANIDDTFTYHVTDSYNYSDPTTVTISLTNQLPVANPDFYDVSQDTTLTAAAGQGTIEGLLPPYADTDPDPGDTLSAYLDAGGTTTQGGNVALNPDGSFTYTPPAGWGGIDTFMYYVSDGYNNSDPASVTITATIRTPTGEEISGTLPPVPPDLGDIGQIEGAYLGDLLWLAEELGLCEGDEQREDESRCQEIQAYLAGAFLQSTNVRPHQAATRLRELAAVLHDTDGSHIVALGRVVNEFVNTAVPPSPEQFASISQALASGGEGAHYATARQWLDALTEYVAILVGDIGWPADESVAFAMGKYGPAVTEAGTISITAFIQMYLEGFTG
ncbi:MAG: Ig-like domain-containing protein, partial [Planctomycetota bacterium]